MPQLDDTSTVLPLAIIAACFALMAIVWLLTLGRPRKADSNSRQITTGTPIVGQSAVTPHQIQLWHNEHGTVVKEWIRNHEQTLKKVSEGGLSIDLSSGIGDIHQRLGPAIDDAVASHPSPPMRSQLSALVLASRNTVEALRRSNWTNAEKFHLSYLEYRDIWLDRLRKGSRAARPARDTTTPHERADIARTQEPDTTLSDVSLQNPLVPSWTDTGDQT